MLPVIAIISLSLMIFGFIATRCGKLGGDEVQAKQYGAVPVFGLSLFIGILITLALLHS